MPQTGTEVIRLRDAVESAREQWHPLVGEASPSRLPQLLDVLPVATPFAPGAFAANPAFAAPTVAALPPAYIGDQRCYPAFETAPQQEVGQ